MINEIRFSKMNSGQKFALLYGIMLGDGCLSLVNGRKKFVSITGSSIEDLSFFENVVSPLLFDFRGKSTKIKFRKSCNAIDFNFVDGKLFDLFKRKKFPVGKKGPNVKIPSYFYELGLINFITQGFFATDGSLVLTKNPVALYPRIEAHSVSKILIRQIYDYLTPIGFKGGFYKCKRIADKTNFKNIQEKYRFQFNGLKNLVLFNNLVGFVNFKHQNKFNNFICKRENWEKMAALGIEPRTSSFLT